MPLFGSRTTTEPTTTTTRTTHTPTTSNSPPARHRSIFNRRRSSSSSIEGASPKRSSVLHRHGEDASIMSARKRVLDAETAEREADRALLTARAAVRDAREHVKRLEKEAAEEARLAKIKQSQAKAIGKRGKALGRHDHI